LHEPVLAEEAASLLAPHANGLYVDCTLGMGGHIRSGMEDVAYVARGEFATDNAQLVTRAVELCRAVGRPVAAPEQAREIFAL